MAGIKDFAEDVKAKLEVMMKDKVDSIEIETVEKNNITLTGLIFHHGNVCPIVYVDKWYEEYIDGVTSIETAAKEIAENYEFGIRNQPSQIQAEQILDYNFMKTRLNVEAINYDMNREMLSNQKIPFELINDDIALLVRGIILKDRNGLATVKISEEHLKEYGISKEQLFSDAWKSMEIINPYHIVDMADKIYQLHPDVPEFMRMALEESRGEMYVLDCDELNCASYGFNTKYLDAICQQIGEDSIYILPSSIHELIILPGSVCKNNPERFTEMVREVNETSVEQVDFLSDHAYFYSMENKELEKIGQDPDRSYDIEVVPNEDIEDPGDDNI